jgi:hypothetical protein
MPSQLVSSSGCCQPCDSEPVVVNIPGPQGSAGANGTNGTNGVNAFCYTTASFFVPALGASVFVYVTASDFLPESVAGQFFVSVQGLGYMQVTSVDGLRLTLQNPAAGVLSIPNAIPTTLIPAGSLITLAGAVGPQGPAGAAGGASSAGTYIVRTPDASIPSATALDSLSAGYLKTQGSGGFGAVSTVATVPVGDISGVLPIAKGGTNLSSTPTNGQLLIGNGSGYTLASLTAGSNITITPGAGTISIASTASGSSFNYVTFTRRVTSSAPIISAPANPFNSTTYPSTTYSGIDTASGFTAANGRFTAPYAGYYRVSALLQLSVNSGVSDVVIQIRKNGSPIYSCLQFRAPFTVPNEQPVAVEITDQASVSDFYEIYFSIATNSPLLAVGSSFSIQRIQA